MFSMTKKWRLKSISPKNPKHGLSLTTLRCTLQDSNNATKRNEVATKLDAIVCLVHEPTDAHAV